MDSSPPTRASLLIKIRNHQDADAWEQFFAIYTPLVYAYCRKRGLQDADASDIAQDVLQTIAKTIGRFEYDSKIGSFRGWLFVVTRNKLRDYVNKSQNSVKGSGDSAVKAVIDNFADDASEEESWNEEYRKYLFEWAAEKVRPDFTEKSWNAFWATAVESQSPSEVATELGMTTGAIYIAKSRVIARVREVVNSVDDFS